MVFGFNASRDTQSHNGDRKRDQENRSESRLPSRDQKRKDDKRQKDRYLTDTNSTMQMEVGVGGKTVIARGCRVSMCQARNYQGFSQCFQLYRR